MLEECTPTTKSSETQFCKPFSASEIIPKQTKFLTEGYEFSLRSFWQVMEPKRSSYGQGTVVLRIRLKWISETRDIVNPASRVTCSHPRAILRHSKWPIIFEQYECNVEELVCTVLSNNKHMCMDKNMGGSGMGDKPCKTASFWVFGAPKRLLLQSRLSCWACWFRNSVM